MTRTSRLEARSTSRLGAIRAVAGRPDAEGRANGSWRGSRLLTLLVLATVVAQLPPVKALFYEQFRVALYLGFAAAVFIALRMKSRASAPLLVAFTWVMGYAAALVLVLTLISGEASMTPLIEVMAPCGVLLAAYRSEQGRRQTGYTLFFYEVLAAILGAWAVIHYNSGAAISRAYVVESKNQIGPILGIACLAALFFALKRWAVGGGRSAVAGIMHSVLATTLLLSMLYVRNRSGIVGVTIVGCMMVFHALGRLSMVRKVVVALLGACAASLAIVFDAFGSIAGFYWDSLTLNYDPSDMDSVSAGRLEGYRWALRFIWENPLLGESGSPGDVAMIPHNYLLNKWVLYGLVGAAPFVLYYLGLWWRVLARGGRASASSELSQLSRALLLFVLLVSLVEYSYPFGPGTSTVMVWFILGLDLARRQSEEDVVTAAPVVRKGGSSVR